MDTSDMIHEYIRERIPGKGKQKVGVIVGLVYKGAICTGFSKANWKAGDVFDKDAGLRLARERALGMVKSPFLPTQMVYQMYNFKMRCLKYFQQADYLMARGSYKNPCKCSDYGDGCYEDNKDNEYGVDAGMLGCIPIDSVIDKSGLELGTVHEFPNPFKTSYDNGKITFGHIVIDTDPHEEYEDED